MSWMLRINFAYVESTHATQLFILVVYAMMAPLFNFLSVSIFLFLYVCAEMSSSCQSSTPSTVFCTHPSFEYSSLYAEAITAQFVGAVQLT